MKNRKKLSRAAQEFLDKQNMESRRAAETWEDKYRQFEQEISSSGAKTVSRQEALKLIPTLGEDGRDFQIEDFLELYKEYLRENFEPKISARNSPMVNPAEESNHPSDPNDPGQQVDTKKIKSDVSDMLANFLGSSDSHEFDDSVKKVHNNNPLPKLAEGSEALINDNQVKSGKLSREFMAQALLEVLSQRGLSVRKAAEVAGVSASVISTIKDQSASIDKSLDVLRALGYEIDCALKPDTL